jgi:hypothetical protein
VRKRTLECIRVSQKARIASRASRWTLTAMLQGVTWNGIGPHNPSVNAPTLSSQAAVPWMIILRVLLKCVPAVNYCTVWLKAHGGITAFTAWSPTDSAHL